MKRIKYIGLLISFFLSHISYAQFELPTSLGEYELIRYPFLQTERASMMKFSWATRTKGSGIVFVKSRDGKVLNASIAECSYNPSMGVFQFISVVTGLKENERYVYDILKDDVFLAKNIPFKTLSDTPKFGFVVIGDTGLDSETIINMRNRIMARDDNNELIHPFDFSIGVGDLAYDNGSDSEFDVAFFRQFSGQSDGAPKNSMISSRPFFPVLGNHEYRTENAIGFRRAFNVPVPHSSEGYAFDLTDEGRFYSFDNGNAHFIVVDTEVWGENRSRATEMLAWVKNDLEESSKPWKFIFYHRSPLSFGIHGFNTGEDWGEMDDNRTIRNSLMTLCQDNGVNMVFYGHDHMYQRSVLLKINRDEDGSIVRNSDLSIASENGIVYVGNGWGKPGDEEPMRTPITRSGSRKWKRQQKITGIGFDWLARCDHDGDGVFETDEYAMVDGEAKYNTRLSSRRGYVYIEIDGTELKGYAFTTHGEIADYWTIQLNR